MIVKKFIIFLVVMMLMNVNQMSAESDVSKARIDYGNSQIYSQADMDAAILIIKDVFKKWDGCELHSIRYTDDDFSNNEENIKWMNELAEGRGYKVNFTQCIAFFSDFHSPKQADNQTAFNIDSEYTNWTWYLAREDAGDWKLMTFGY